MEELFVFCKVWEQQESLYTKGYYSSVEYKQIENDKKQQLEILTRKAIAKGEITSLEEFQREYDVYIPSVSVTPSLTQKDIARITGAYITAMDSLVVFSRIDEVLPLLEEAANSLRMISAECAKPFEKWICELSKRPRHEEYPKEEMKFELERVWNLLHASLA